MNQTEAIKSINIPKMNLPWIDSPFFDRLLEESNLDEEMKKMVKNFSDRGYVVIDPEIKNFGRISEEIIKNLEPEYLRRKADRIQDAWEFNESVKTIAMTPKILSLLRILYQREPIPFQTLNFLRGSQQKTHSDTIHFHSFPARFMCGVWVALEDVTFQNGPLHYYPKSHKLPIFDLHDIGLNREDMEWQEYYPLYENFIEALIRSQGLEKVDISLEKGQAIIWSANLLHGGSPILDGFKTRHTQVTHYFFSDCMYYTPMLSDPFLKKIHLRQVNNILTGEIVPHVYNGKQISIERLDKQLENTPENSSKLTSLILNPVKYAKGLLVNKR